MLHDLVGRGKTVDVLAAYRLDVANRGNTPIGDTDGVWLQFGNLLSHSVTLTGVGGEHALLEATQLARGMMTTTAWLEGNRFDPEPPTDSDTLHARIRTIAETIEVAGAMRLADAILEAFLLAHPKCGALEQGRVEAERARIAWKGGDLEVAAERYRQAGIIGKMIDSNELRVRALIGQALLARLAGNYPASASRAERAFRLAERANCRRLAASAQHTMMVAAAISGDHAAALKHGWTAFLHATGDRMIETDVLGNLGQLFLDMGHPATAIAALKVVIHRRPPSRVLLPALGGYAIAAARLNDKAMLDSAAAIVEDVAKLAATPYAIAVAYLEIAEAYAILRDSGASAKYRRSALLIAEGKRYNELVYRAETAMVPTAPATRALLPDAERIAGAVRELALA